MNEDMVLDKTAVETTGKTTVKTAEHENKTAPNGMPVYDIKEPWVQHYIEDFGTEPSFF